jgi:hypothetical protein
MKGPLEYDVNDLDSSFYNYRASRPIVQDESDEFWGGVFRGIGLLLTAKALWALGVPLFYWFLS